MAPPTVRLRRRTNWKAMRQAADRSEDATALQRRASSPDARNRWKGILPRVVPYTIRLKVPETYERPRSPTNCAAQSRSTTTTSTTRCCLNPTVTPLTTLANVVDDHLMQITDVIRAEEWISSTPKHVSAVQGVRLGSATFLAYAAAAERGQIKDLQTQKPRVAGVLSAVRLPAARPC